MNRLMRLFVGVALVCGAMGAEACTAVIVGKKASATGHVIIGHNEDNGGLVSIRHALVPTREYGCGETLREPGGAALAQPARSASYFWSEVKHQKGWYIPGDLMFNEHGVLVFSNNGGRIAKAGPLPDEGEYSTLTEGGVSHSLRRAVAERARSAREGVDIMTNLVTRYGYKQPARIFTIADRDEAWVVEVVQGRRFVARRCPDDAVVVHPNCLSIREIRPGDIVSGNIEPKRAEFDFTRAYQGPRTWKSAYNRHRWRYLYQATCGVDLSEKDYPFSVVPAAPVTAEFIRKGLCSHYEGTKDEVKDPHGETAENHGVPLCRRTTIESVICLFGDTPEKTVLRLATGRPCETPYGDYRPFAGSLPADAVRGAEAIRRLDNHFKPEFAGTDP